MDSPQAVRGLGNRLIYGLGSLPVKVLRGVARGAWWSIYPFSVYWRCGGGEPEVNAIFESYRGTPDMVFWDIGAHHGIYSVGLARRCGKMARIEAFEPSPLSQKRLRWHRKLNGLSQIRIHPVAVSEKTAETRLYGQHNPGSSSSHLAWPDENTEGVPSLPVQAVRLDDWMDEGRLSPPQLVKIDVEGHAVPALRGMRETLAKYLPTIIFAVHCVEERDVGGGILTELGYTLKPVSESAAEAIRTRAFGEFLCQPPV